MRVLILAADATPLSTVSGPLEALSLAAEMAASRGGEACELAVAGESSGPLRGSGGLQFHTLGAIREQAVPDLLLVAAIGNPLLRQRPFDADMLQWIRAAYAQGTVVASICTGAFLLAQTGLLDEHLATTHWAFEDPFRVRFPKVRLAIDQLVTEDSRLICSGGATAYIDLSLYLIERYYGRQIADRCGHFLVADRRARQSPYREFHGDYRHEDNAIKGVQRWLEGHYAENISGEQMAQQIHLSPRQFHRRFKQATGRTYLDYLQQVRVEKAKYLLQVTQRPVDTIAPAVGYEDLAFFRRLFKRATGMSPTRYRQQCSAAMAGEPAAAVET